MIFFSQDTASQFFLKISLSLKKKQVKEIAVKNTIFWFIDDIRHFDYIRTRVFLKLKRLNISQINGRYESYIYVLIYVLIPQYNNQLSRKS